MRQFLLLAALLPVFPLACSQVGEPGEVTLEAGVPTPFYLPDGALPDVTLPATPSVLEEAGPPEAAPAEAAPPEAAPPPPDVAVPPVKLTVVSDFGPEPGVTILVSDASGNRLSTFMTDTTGSVSMPLAAGVNVTALLGYSLVDGAALNPSLVTYMGVQPGDDLTVLDTTNRYGVSVITPTQPTDGAPHTLYNVQVGACGQGSAYGQINLGLDPGCYGQGSFPALALGENLSCSTPPCSTGYAFKKGNSLAVIPDGGNSPTVDLSSALWNTDVGTQNITGVNVPDALAGATGIASYTEFASGVGFTEWQRVTRIVPDGGVSKPFETHPQYPDFVQSEVDILVPSTHPLIRPYYSVVRRTTTPSGSESLDMSKLPPLTATAAADFSTSSPSLSWLTTAPVTSSVGTIVTLQFTSFNGLKWTFVVPPGVTSIRAPNIPSEVATLFDLPSKTSFPPISWYIATLTGTALADYAALRKAAGSMINLNFNPNSCDETGTLLGPILPANGDLVITGFLSFSGNVCP
jgi:hypothetical protein